jgi:hypothetical protein
VNVLIPSVRHLGAARRAVWDRLCQERVAEGQDLRAVEIVVNELLGAACESRLGSPVTVTVEPHSKVTAVRVRCPRPVQLRDEPFDVRGRLLGRLTLAFGQRPNGDGTVDLWAELPRRTDTPPPT